MDRDQRLIEFCQQAVRIPSPSGQEREVAQLMKRKMEEYGFDEFWVSDNTDALQRVYMQWGTSYFFPAIAMASHISAAPNHQTFLKEVKVCFVFQFFCAVFYEHAHQFL